MKICPTCKKTYGDEELNFCLDDGATLIKKRGAARTADSRKNEVVAVSLIALAMLIFLCLVSYSASDPTFNSASSERVQNWIGFVGANFAELLISIAGSVAYLFPALLALIAWRVFRSDGLRPRVHRVVGFALFVGSACGLVSLFGWHGGIVGALLAKFAIYLLSGIGGGILLTASFLVSVLLISDLSFLGLWGNFELARENFKIHYDEWREKRKKVHNAQVEAAKLRFEKRREIRDTKGQPEPPTITIAEAGGTRANARAAAAGGSRETGDLGVAETSGGLVPETIAVSASGRLSQQQTSGAAAAVARTDEVEVAGENYIDAVRNPDASDLADREPVKVNYENYVLPEPGLLNAAPPHILQKEKELYELADLLTEKTREFNVSGKVVNISPGPVVTTFEFKPDPGVKYSRVTGLVDDLCLALQAESIRIDRIPGKAYVGIEVPNSMRETIRLRDVIESKSFRESNSLLTIALGKTIDGANYVSDLATMPHLLIAGATGAGKSVGVNALVVSVLYKARPDEVKFIMVDPKRLELGVYADIPHLATPIITDPKRAAISLKWAVVEMERRYRDLAGYGVRNIDGYNAEARRRNSLEQWDDNGEPHRTLPYIVIIIDELADLMMVAGRDVEESITRLAQMARAVGIHLVLATQRPSVDVITGLIKANFPARISFRVSSKVDSRTIIDSNGAEALLGRGDMLFLPPATSQVIRVHGAFVDEKEIGRIVDHIKKQGRPEYDATITKGEDDTDEPDDLPGRRDPLFWDALKCVVNAKRGSTSLLQRHLRIGYGRAAAILDAMVKEGYIGDMDGSTRARPVLQKAYDDLQDLSEMENDR